MKINYHDLIKLPEVNSPIVMFNKSHSGSRLLAELIENAGVFIGSNLNSSNDSLDILKLVRYLVLNYYPDYTNLWFSKDKDLELIKIIEDTFSSHLSKWNLRTNKNWGWKLCETTYIIPVIDYLFPKAKYIHLIRDGRDVAFSNHRAPHDVFWRKIYFNTGTIEEWNSLKMNKKCYNKKSHIFNAIHWNNSVTVGKYFGAMLRDRYLEVKYENLCNNFDIESKKILDFLDLEVSPAISKKIKNSIYVNRMGKYKKQSNRKIKEVCSIIKPLLISLNYLNEKQ